MWRTGTGDRSIKGAEWALFREAISALWDRIDEAGDDGDVQPMGVDLFDELQPNQKLAMLAIVGEALSRDDVEPPELTAVGEATIAAVFAFLSGDIAFEVDMGRDPSSPPDGEEPIDWTTWRAILLAAYVEANPDDDEGDDEEDGGKVSAATTDLDLWASMIEDLQNRILWEDGDYEMGQEFLDLSPAMRKKKAKQLGLDPGYFLAIAPDPTDREMDAVRERLRALTWSTADGEARHGGKDSEVRSVIERLRAHVGRLEAVRSLIAERSPLNADDKKRAQLLMKAAKDLLREDHKRMSSVKGRAALNATARAFLAPAVHEASAHLCVKWNSDPSTWSGDLYESILDLNHLLRQLECHDNGPGRG